MSGDPTFDVETGMVTVHTQECLLCGKPGMVQMPEDAYRRWAVDRAFIQVAWPEGSPGDREMLINGTHDECFKTMFPEEDEQ